MYYGHLNDKDLNFLHHRTLVSRTFKYEDMSSNTLFKIVEHGNFVEINPLFYYANVEVSDPTAVIRENNIIIKKNNNTEFTFTSPQKIQQVQVYAKKTDNAYSIYLLNEWCDGLHDIPVRVTTAFCDTMLGVPLETTTILTEDYRGDFKTYYPNEHIETTDYTTSTDGLIIHITDTTPIYIEININNEKYCFKTGGIL